MEADPVICGQLAHCSALSVEGTERGRGFFFYCASFTRLLWGRGDGISSTRHLHTQRAAAPPMHPQASSHQNDATQMAFYRGPSYGTSPWVAPSVSQRTEFCQHRTLGNFSTIHWSLAAPSPVRSLSKPWVGAGHSCWGALSQPWG